MALLERRLALELVPTGDGLVQVRRNSPAPRCIKYVIGPNIINMPQSCVKLISIGLATVLQCRILGRLPLAYVVLAKLLCPR